MSEVIRTLDFRAVHIPQEKIAATDVDMLSPSPVQWPSMTLKLYVYSDESGQDTQGRLFVVATVILPAEDQERHRQLLERIERDSGKGKRKWTQATPRQRRPSMASILQHAAFHGHLFYARFLEALDYERCMLNTIASSVTHVATGQPCKATILIDGLPKSLRARSAAALREQLPRERVRIDKVRGLNEQSDPLMRLADSVAGMVRHAMQGRAEAALLVEEAPRRNVLREMQT